MKFPSKVDGWLIPVMIVSFAGLLTALVAVMISPTPWPIRILVVVVLVLVTFLLISVFRNTSYEVDSTDLRIVSGPFKWTVPIADITEIKPTRNPLSSPALSLDRLKVSYGKRKWVLISPADKDGFKRAIAKVQQAGDRRPATE